MSAVVNFQDYTDARPLPQAIDAEQSVLGALMLDPRAMSKVSDWLKPEDFLRSDHQLIYRAIDGLIGKGSPVDAVTLADWFQANDMQEMLDQGLDYLIHLSNSTASAANIVSYAEIVAEKSRLRSLIDIGTSLAADAAALGAESIPLATSSGFAISTVQANKARGGLEPAKGAMSRMFAELMRRYEGNQELLGEPWPWFELNKCTKGLRDGSLYILAARPSMGKSAAAIQTAAMTAARGNNTFLFSVEMTSEECMTRATACIGNIPHEWVENPNRDDPDGETYWARLTTATGILAKAPLMIDDTPGIGIDSLMARARREHARKPARLIVIDHLHDMALSPKAEARHEYGRIVQGTKTLAKEFNCPVLLLAQLNRGLESRQDKHPTLSDLRESGEIEQKADVILFLYRDEYYNPQSHLKGTVEIVVGKGRNIKKPDQNILLEAHLDKMRFDDWDGGWPAPPPEPMSAPKSSRGFGSNR